MFKISSLIFFIVLSLTAFGGKNYELTVKVLSLYEKAPIQGLKISTVINKQKIEIGITDKDGTILIKELKDKYLDVIVEDLKGIYKSNTLYYYNPKKVDEIEIVNLKFTKTIEDSIFQTVDLKYQKETDEFLERMKTDSLIDTVNYTEPVFMNGKIDLYKFISSNIEFTQEAIENGIQGKVYVSFIIQKDGTVTNVNVIRGIDKNLDKIAVRIVRYTNKWNPASKNGKPIQSYLTIPISFRLN